MNTILVTDAIDIEMFRQIVGDFQTRYEPGMSYEELKDAISGVDVLVVRPRMKLDKAVLEGSSVRFIGIMGSGTDNIDLDYAQGRGIEVVNLPLESIDSVAEYTIFMLGNLARKIVQANSSLKELKWEKDALIGTRLKGKVLGILGMGRIGRSVTSIAVGFGMDVIGYDPYVTQDDIQGLGCTMVKDLGEFLKRSDFMTVHVPLMDETQHLIGKQEIEKMKDGVLIVNASRARLFERETLISSLQAGKIGGYATDVHYEEPVGDDDKELLSIDRVLCTPHIGAQTIEVQRTLAEKMATGILKTFKK